MTQATQAAHPQTPVEVWAQDEHRIGLKPILRRVWSPKGQRPLAVVRPRYQWSYLYGFVRPSTGDTFWLLLPTVSVEAFQMALNAFAAAVGAGPHKQVLLVVDRAGWHVSPQLRLPVGLHLIFLPAYSPELQPAERLWPLTNESLANRTFASLDDLHENQIRRCLVLQATPERIRGLTAFHWWPQLA